MAWQPTEAETHSVCCKAQDLMVTLDVSKWLGDGKTPPNNSLEAFTGPSALEPSAPVLRSSRSLADNSKQIRSQ